MPSSVMSDATMIRSAPVSCGAELTFETLSPASAELRRRRREDTLLRVIHGTVLLSVENEPHVLTAGGEAIIPAGAAHRLACDTSAARIVMGFRSPRG